MQKKDVRFKTVMITDNVICPGSQNQTTKKLIWFELSEIQLNKVRIQFYSKYYGNAFDSKYDQ